MPEEHPVCDTSRPLAYYRIEAEFDFLGALPEHDLASALEVSDAMNAAVDAFKAVLREHGFEPARTGYGAKRLRTWYPPEAGENISNEGRYPG